MTRRRWWATVAGALALAGLVAALAGSQSAPHTGLSAQRLPVTLTVAPDGGTLSLDVTWMTACGGLVRTIRPAATTIAADGTFAWTGTYVEEVGDGDQDRHRLSLAGRRESDGTLAGTWRGERDAYNGQGRSIDGTCSSGDVAFGVRAGGSAAQPAPRRDGTGHLVTALEDEPLLAAAGADSAWVLGRAAGIGGPGPPKTTVTAIDRASGVAAAPTRADPIGYAVASLAAGEGAVWVLRPDGRLVRIDARTRRVVSAPRLPAPRGTQHVEVADGGVWVLASDRVLRADPRDGRLVRTIRIPADRRFASARRCRRTTHATHMAARRNELWVVTRAFLSCRSRASPQAFALARRSPLFGLVRIDTRTSRVTRAVALTREYGALAAGSGGVWVVGCLKAPTPPAFTCRRPAAHRIDLRTGRPAVAVALPSIPAAEPVSPVQLASGLAIGRGALWIVQAGGPLPSQSPSQARQSSVLRRIDLTTRRLTTVREIPHPFAGLAVDDHGAWIVDGLDRTLIRVDP